MGLNGYPGQNTMLGGSRTSPFDFLQGVIPGLQNFLGGGMGAGMGQVANPPPGGGYGDTGQYNGLNPGMPTPGGGMGYGPTLPGARNSGYGGTAAGAPAAGAPGAAGGAPGAAAGGVPGAMPGAGAPPPPSAPLGTGLGSRSFIDPANAYKDPGTAVTQAMIELGINPLRGGPAVATVMSQAQDLVNNLLVNALNTGNDLFATPNGFADALRNQVRTALHGGNVFYGPGQAGAAALEQARNILAGMGQGPGTSALGSTLATDLQNASTAGNTMQSLLYAGGNPAARQQLSGWTQLIPLIVGQMLNQSPEQFAPNAAGNAPSALDLLPQILGFKYQPPQQPGMPVRQ